MVRYQVSTGCGEKAALRSDGFDFGNDFRIKERITDTTVSGPYVEREQQFSGGPVVG